MSETRYRMEVESLDLGADVPAVGLELIDPQTREPVAGTDAARIWAASLVAIVGSEPWTLDFFAHLDRVSEFCRSRGIPFRQPNPRVLIVERPSMEPLAALAERFAGETFGARAGEPAASEDTELEGDLAKRGVDGYHPAFPNYLFCAVCDFENGFLTILSKNLWASEVIRRVRSAVAGLQVDVLRPS